MDGTIEGMTMETIYKDAMQYGDKPAFGKYTLWWISDDRQASMFFGNFEIYSDALNSIPLAKQELSDTCDCQPDCGNWTVEFNDEDMQS